MRSLPLSIAPVRQFNTVIHCKRSNQTIFTMSRYLYSMPDTKEISCAVFQFPSFYINTKHKRDFRSLSLVVDAYKLPELDCRTGPNSQRTLNRPEAPEAIHIIKRSWLLFRTLTRPERSYVGVSGVFFTSTPRKPCQTTAMLRKPSMGTPTTPARAF